MTVSTALIKSEKIIPAKMSVLSESDRSTVCANLTTANTVTTAPKEPASGSDTAEKLGVKKSVQAAQRDAPDETPMVYADASRFFKQPCIITPVIAKAPPHKNAVNTRGRRTRIIITSIVFNEAGSGTVKGSFDKNIFTVNVGETYTDPMPTPKMITHRETTTEKITFVFIF